MEYKYVKIRKNFGRQPMFSTVPVHLLDSINPNLSLQKQYGLRNPVSSQSQKCTFQSEHAINTKPVVLHNQGVNHAEGGWPKEIQFQDDEATSRYRRRVERDDDYINAVLDVQPMLQHYVDQNNAVEMYQMYFKGMEEMKPIESFSTKINNVYRDPDSRPVACIDWTSEECSKITVAYCDRKYPSVGPVNKNFSCFIWDLENANHPAFNFEPPKPCWQIACSPTSPSVIIAGLDDGRVCIFDIRLGIEPICLSEFHLAHRDPVSALLYMPSRLNTEFFSGSSDGRCMWYDIRNIKMPTDTLIMTIRAPPGNAMSLAYAEGVSALQYDRAFPAKFLCGTDTGYVINVNRKGKTLNEVFNATFLAHRGPVRAVHRSPCTSKMFITCGDWTTHVWSEEVLTSPIITGTQQRYQVFDVAWAPHRVTSYMTVSGDGKFRYWDLLRKLRDPIIVLPLTKNALLKIKPHYDGRLIAMGGAKGEIHVISLSETLVLSGDNDKPLMSQTYERETHRERILENRVKEIRLKLKTDEETTTPVEIVDDEAILEAAEEEYKRVVLDEMRTAGIPRPNTSKKVTLRSR